MSTLRDMIALKGLFLFLSLVAIGIFGFTKIDNGKSSIGSSKDESKTILMAILARNKAHVLPTYLQCIDNLEYNKKLITLYINTNNNEDETKKILDDWVAKNQKLYRKVIVEGEEVKNLGSSDPHDWTNKKIKVLAKIRNQSLQKAIEEKTDYYFVADCDNFIASYTLRDLIGKEKPIIAPMLKAIPEKNDDYSNFFYALNAEEYFGEHDTFYEILDRHIVGTFKVPVVHCTYLIDAKHIPKLTYSDDTNDHEFIIFSRSARKNGVDQYICNEKNYGTLLHFFEDDQVAIPKGLFTPHIGLEKERVRWKQAYEELCGQIVGN